MQLTESEILELKKSTSELKAGIVSLVAMLNKHHRGELWFGIKNDGTAIGQNVSAASLREVSRSIGDHIEPKVYPSVEKIMIDGKPCIRVLVEGKDVPYFAYGRAYIRVGDEDRQLSANGLENFILQKNRDRLRWDMEICPQATQDDISSTKLKRFLKSCGLKYDTVLNALDKLNLIKNHKLLNAAVLCFAKKPEKYFPNARLRCATFGTTDTTVTLDMKDITGDVFILIQRAEEYILEHINIGMRLEGLLGLMFLKLIGKPFVKPLLMHSVTGIIENTIQSTSPSSRIGWRYAIPACYTAGSPFRTFGKRWFPSGGMNYWRNCSSAAI